MFILYIDSINDKDLKIKVLRDRVISLEKSLQSIKRNIKKSSEEVDPLWKDISGKEFYNSSAWRRLRYLVLETHDKVCVLCGSNSNLHVDHIVPRSIDPSKALDIKNMQILCKDCNIGKSNKPIIKIRKK